MWSNLAKVVYRRTYARKDTGTTENWNDTVERVIAGNVRGHRVSEDEINRLRYFVSQRKATPAGRGLWFSGAPAHGKLGGAALNNCFSGETRFWCDGRLVSLSDAAGKEVSVLCHDLRWRPASVRPFGVQRLNTIRMKVPGQSNFVMEFTATANHRWLTTKGETTSLAVGDRVLVRTMSHDTESPDYAAGFIHGLVFGDGTRHTYYPNRFIIRLCGEKARHLPVLQQAHGYVSTIGGAYSDNDPVVTIVSKVDMKNIPRDDTGLTYQAGFLAGWLAADGATRNRITTQDQVAVDWLVERAPLLGFCVTGDSIQNNQTNFGKRSAPCHQVVLRPNPVEYSVVEIFDSGREEEVFCVVEPETRSFVLEGGVPTGNCWAVDASDWHAYVVAMDLLMLGGGVGMSVEHRYTSRLPKVRQGVRIEHRNTNDADFIVPDSREGWVELVRRTLESMFVTGRSFSFSTICVRPGGDPIIGFGGTASGPRPLIECVEKIHAILSTRAGRHVRPIDAADLLCCIGEMVVAGNVRRSAIIILGDPWDREYLTAKRWDIGGIPTYRAMANFSVVAADVDELHPLFWKTYESGEPFGVVNRKAMQTFGRIGEYLSDTASLVNPCAEATLEAYEPCNLQEIALPNLSDVNEFVEAARLMHRWGKRVTCEKYHWPQADEVVKRNRRIGTGITGCLQSPLFAPEHLDRAYAAIQQENREYSKELGIPESIRTTVVKPSGTMSKVMDVYEGIHPAYSRHYIQRVRFGASDPLVPLLRAAGHHIEPQIRFDGSLDHNTVVVDFYCRAPDGAPVADEDWDTWKQLDVVKTATKHWADQAVSVTVYYRREDLPRLKEWLAENLPTLKTISFLCHSEHGFIQAPKEAIPKEQYDALSSVIKPLDEEAIGGGDLDSMECAGGACPIK